MAARGEQTWNGDRQVAKGVHKAGYGERDDRDVDWMRAIEFPEMVEYQ